MAGFPLFGTSIPWSLMQVFPQLRADRTYLDKLSQVCPVVVFPSITGTLLCHFPILDYLFLDPFMDFIPLRMFYFSLPWC